MAQRQFRIDDTAPKWAPKYGNGSEGDKVVSSNVDYDGANAGASGNANAGQKNVGIDAASSFANGDLVLIHQTRGSGVGAWELNKIASGGGTTSLVMKYNLCNNYVEGGNNQFQVLELKQYKNVTVQNGFTWSAPSWDGSKGGIIAFLANGKLIVESGAVISAAYKGYAGGDGASAGSRQGRQGEGHTASPGASQGNNGNGGGGGVPDTAAGDGGGGGAGGGHATAGTVGTSKNNGGPGVAGAVGSDTEDLKTMHFGGGGGEGGADDSGSHGRGGYGGGIVFAIAAYQTILGTILAPGENGTVPSGQDGGHGGGAGGIAYLKGVKLDIGSFLINVLGGVHSSESSQGGDGGVGRIRAEYAISITGDASGISRFKDKTLMPRPSAAGLFVFLQKFLSR